MNINQIVLEAIQYTDEKLGLDPIGASDLRQDFITYVQEAYHSHRFITIKNAWAQFNQDIIKPVYRINIPAV